MKKIVKFLIRTFGKQIVYKKPRWSIYKQCRNCKYIYQYTIMGTRYYRCRECWAEKQVHANLLVKMLS